MNNDNITRMPAQWQPAGRLRSKKQIHPRAGKHTS
jgi:hypothetical protein